VLAVLLAGGSLQTFAHQASDAYLSLTATNGRLQIRLDMAIADLHALLDVDDDVDGRVTWGELKAHQEDAASYIRSNFWVRLDGQPLDLGVFDLLVEERAEEAFAVWLGDLPLQEGGRELEVDYRCLFEVDALHRAFVKFEQSGTPSTAMLGPSQTTHRFALLQSDSSPSANTQGATGFVREGIWHIWTGYDHMLFLLALLLPAVMVWKEGRWEGVANLQQAFLEVVKTVTAFTASHSITLTIASMGWVTISAKLVEPVIAMSVALAAANNIRPFFHGKGWLVAFAFGLIHGFGFASVLQGFELEGRALLWPLVAFNLGVEAGQLIIVLAFLPLAFTFRQTSFYRQGALGFGSAGVCVLALLWFLERVRGS